MNIIGYSTKYCWSKLWQVKHIEENNQVLLLCTVFVCYLTRYKVILLKLYKKNLVRNKLHPSKGLFIKQTFIKGKKRDKPNKI